MFVRTYALQKECGMLASKMLPRWSMVEVQKMVPHDGSRGSVKVSPEYTRLDDRRGVHARDSGETYL